MKRIICDDSPRVSAFVQNILGKGTAFGAHQAIGLEDDEGNLIAGVVFDGYNGVNCGMHVAAVPGKRWMTREFLYVCFAYPFIQLKVRRVTGAVCSSNQEALEFDKHLGFEPEAILKDATERGDLHLLVMWRDSCRWIKQQQEAA